jgi:hypothetical protein
LSRLDRGADWRSGQDAYTPHVDRDPQEQLSWCSRCRAPSVGLGDGARSAGEWKDQGNANFDGRPRTDATAGVRYLRLVRLLSVLTSRSRRAPQDAERHSTLTFFIHSCYFAVSEASRQMSTTLWTDYATLSESVSGVPTGKSSGSCTNSETFFHRSL